MKSDEKWLSVGDWMGRQIVVGKMKRIDLRNNSISIIASTLAVAPPLAGKSYSHLCRIFKVVNNVGRTGFFLGCLVRPVCSIKEDLLHIKPDLASSV